jgi:hypothetical protein
MRPLRFPIRQCAMLAVALAQLIAAIAQLVNALRLSP